ncbi:hypothetical protein AV926_15730 [Myroides marinus]|uniref:Lipoprotein n=1 Tax=Myroides marinus TaxID=703342 RepID=A0A163WNF8_9FLAO|nr:hypothetical protein [Myroides marinus]KZE76591.1 hypothetical protein AV926_15730 [Myroides marinus]
MRKLLLSVSAGILAVLSISCNGQQGHQQRRVEESKEPGIPKESSVTYQAPLNPVFTNIYRSIAQLPNNQDGVSPLDYKYTNEIRSELCLFAQSLGLEQSNNRMIIIERIHKSNVYKFGYYAAILSENSPIYYLKVDDFRTSALKPGSRLIDDPGVAVKVDIELFYKIAQTSDLEAYNANKEEVAHKESVNSRIYLHIIDRAGSGFRTITYRLK